MDYCSRKFYLIIIILVSFRNVDGEALPVFVGEYPTSTNVNDDESPTRVLHTFNVTDADGVRPVMSYTFEPADSEEMFDITPSDYAGGITAEVTLAAGYEFNYESQSSYKITASATDGTLTATNKQLTIIVDDVGEAPTLDPPTVIQTFTTDEGPASAVIGRPNFTIVDDDIDDVHTWSIAGGTGEPFLNLNPGDGSIAFLVDYDLETVEALTIDIVVNITDKYGKWVNTTYIVTISDVNDNAPVLNQSEFSITTVEITSPIGTVYATLTAADADFTSPNNEFTYSMGSQELAGYFTMNGSDLTLIQMFDVSYGQVSNEFHVYAIDGGSPPNTATATITVTTPTSTSTTPTTTLIPPAGYDWFKETNNVIMLAGVCFMVAVLLGYLLVMCWRWNTFGECMPTKCPTSQELKQCCGGRPNDRPEKGRLNSVVIKPDLAFAKKDNEAVASQVANSKFRSGNFHTSRVTNL